MKGSAASLTRSLWRRLGPLVLLGALLASCSGPEEKKMMFLSRGKALYQQGACARAAVEFRKALQIDPHCVEAHFMLGMAQVNCGDLKAAFNSFSRAVVGDPRHLKARAQLGRLQLARGQAAQALAAAERVLREDPRDVEAQLLKGRALLALGQCGPARGHLKSLLGGGCCGVEVYLLLAASAYREDDECGGAEEVLLMGLAAHPGSIQLNRALASLLFQEERYDEAAIRVERVIELEPANFSNLITLAGLYWDIGGERQSRSVLQRLLMLHPNREHCRLLTARFFHSRKRPADAERELQAGIRENGRSLRLRLALAELYLQLGKSAAARAMLNECLKLAQDRGDPHLARARQLLALLQQRQQQ